MNGLSPLTYTTIRHWAILTGNAPDAEDVRALIFLDSVMLNPGVQKKVAE